MANLLKSSGRVAAVTFNTGAEVISNAAELISVGSELISLQLNSLRDEAQLARQAVEDNEAVKEYKLRALQAEAEADVLEELYLQESRLAKIRAKVKSAGLKLHNEN